MIWQIIIWQREYQRAKDELRTALNDARATNFSAQLFRLIAKADPKHLELIQMGFPAEVQVWQDWQRSKDECQFFSGDEYEPPRRTHGLKAERGDDSTI